MKQFPWIRRITFSRCNGRVALPVCLLHLFEELAMENHGGTGVQERGASVLANVVLDTLTAWPNAYNCHDPVYLVVSNIIAESKLPL